MVTRNNVPKELLMGARIEAAGGRQGELDVMEHNTNPFVALALGFGLYNFEPTDF